ncbi:acyl-CoA dehydrogenase/oxidase [Phaeosphaeriaceae sp. PMI808]|nr:acyl-CoA dehydrogenase/oxidase [Phaeosphaeriaceae sp. PMI808]
MQQPQPASSRSGFFQALPVLPPQYTSLDALSSQPKSRYKNATEASDDKVLARVLDLYLPSKSTKVTEHAHRIARLSLDPSVLVHATDAESNHPVLRPLTTFGEENRNDPLWTTTGWQKLKEIGCTGTMTGCPMSMTDGAATLLAKHLHAPDKDQPGRKEVFQKAYERLTSRDPKFAWTSGQWMTERAGGSDVSGTETIAHRISEEEKKKADNKLDAVGMPLGPWKIDGFKWFSSATDSEMAVLLARTSKGGLSAFYMPMRRRVSSCTLAGRTIEEIPPKTELNGVRIQRLKNKLGTKSLPTAELELEGARGWLIGTEGQGVKEISAVLNITRLSTGTGSAANWGRGLAICRAYSKTKYWAAAHFAFLGVALQGSLEQDWDKMVANTKAAKLIPKDKTQVATLLRLILPVMKAQVSVASVHGLRQCMECLGGVGYCENNEDGGLLNIAKIYRDNLVNPIWEGTVSVMAEDVVRVLLDRRLGNGNTLLNIFVPWVHNVLASCSTSFNNEVEHVEQRLKALLSLFDGAQKEELLYRGRELLKHLEIVVSSLCVLYDASVNPEPVAEIIARRWVESKAIMKPVSRSRLDWTGTVKSDRMVFLGNQGSSGSSKL